MFLRFFLGYFLVVFLVMILVDSFMISKFYKLVLDFNNLLNNGRMLGMLVVLKKMNIW